MRILVDECLPEDLVGWLDRAGVKTARQMGWAGISKGQLLKSRRRVPFISLKVSRSVSRVFRHN